MPTLEDVDVMARTIFGEARGEPFQGQIAVAWVIRNRSEAWHESIKDVCLAPKQFSAWNANDPNRQKMMDATLEDPAFMTAQGVACLVLTDKLADPTYGALFYYVSYTTTPPVWAQTLQQTIIIGRHRFMKPR